MLSLLKKKKNAPWQFKGGSSAFLMHDLWDPAGTEKLSSQLTSLETALVKEGEMGSLIT